MSNKKSMHVHVFPGISEHSLILLQLQGNSRLEFRDAAGWRGVALHWALSLTLAKFVYDKNLITITSDGQLDTWFRKLDRR